MSSSENVNLLSFYLAHNLRDILHICPERMSLINTLKIRIITFSYTKSVDADKNKIKRGKEKKNRIPLFAFSNARSCPGFIIGQR